jgi:glycerate dehydrogenase
MTHKIVFLDKATVPEHIQFKPLDFDHEWLNFDLTSVDQIVDRAKDADTIITNKVPLDQSVIQQLPKLKHIAVCATGYNIIDVATCSENNIVVTNTPDYSVTAVPEHALALILALRRHLFAYQHSVRAGDWHKSPFFHGYLSQTFDLKGARLGIIGGGSLGTAMAALAKNVGMEVVFAERKGQAASYRPAYIAFDELITSSDVVSIHCPLTEDTRDLIALNELAAMQTHALLINTARGGIVNEADLVTALEQGLIAGAGFDVATEEPIKNDNPLLTLLEYPNFILTPHIAWTSDASLQCQADILVNNLEQFYQGTPVNRVA